MKSDVIDIIITEDHPTYSLGIEQSLNNYDHVNIIAKVSSGKELLQILHSKTPNLILMDIMMPGINGIDTAKEVKRLYSYVKIIFVTMYQEAQVVNQCMKYGEGYISKTTTTEELINVIDTVMSGKTSYRSVPLQNFQLPASYNDEITKMFKLTKREIELIHLLKAGLSTKEIAQNLFLSFFTIETHRKNIIRKLQVKNVAELIAFANKNNI